MLKALFIYASIFSEGKYDISMVCAITVEGQEMEMTMRWEGITREEIAPILAEDDCAMAQNNMQEN